MSDTFDKVNSLVIDGKYRLSQHGIEEMHEDGITLTSLLQSLASSVVIEDYPDAWKGPTVLLLQEFEGLRFHAIWGISKTTVDLATLVTAYVPDKTKWTHDFLKRLQP